jgi:hypothetical protein
MRRLPGAKETAGRPAGQEASALGRTAGWLAGVLRGGLDKVTRTSYQACQSWPRTPARREARASARLLQGRAGRNAWERAMHDDAERRQEIGLRRALDATKGQILIQFLAEAVLLSLAGSTAGAVAALARPECCGIGERLAVLWGICGVISLAAVVDGCSLTALPVTRPWRRAVPGPALLPLRPIGCR